MMNRKLKSKNYFIGPSQIQGQGVFANIDFRKGGYVGKLHTIIPGQEYDYTELGKMYNHSDTPNAINVLDDDNTRHLVTLRDIRRGEELTADYRLQPDLEQPEDWSKEGYKDDSPYKNEPFIDIDDDIAGNGTQIDMSETGKTLSANGRVLQPYSGMHQFDEDVVREIPLAQDGGEKGVPPEVQSHLDRGYKIISARPGSDEKGEYTYYSMKNTALSGNPESHFRVYNVKSFKDKNKSFTHIEPRPAKIIDTPTSLPNKLQKLPVKRLAPGETRLEEAPVYNAGARQYFDPELGRQVTVPANTSQQYRTRAPEEIPEMDPSFMAAWLEAMRGDRSSSDVITNPNEGQSGTWLTPEQRLNRPHHLSESFDILNKQEGGTIEEQVYSMFPALQNMGEVTFKADPEFTREVTGVGDIEYFSPKRNRTQITYPNSFVYQHPKPGTHGIVYNPETNNAQSIALDMLHGLSKDDNKYNRLRNKFKRKFLTSKFKDDVERDWERKLEEEGKGDGKSHFINNHIDGVIRNLLFEGAPEDFENYRYWPEARDTYLDAPEINEAFTGLETYLKTPIKQEGGEYEELELTDEEIEEYKKGGYIVEELPKAQSGGLIRAGGKKLPGYTLAEIKVAGLNRNMFKHPQTGDIRFEPIPYTQLHPQAFQFNVGDKKYWEFQEDMGKAMLSLKGDKGFPDFNLSDFITHRAPGIKGKPNDLTDFAQKKIKEILLEKGWTNDDILKYTVKNLELRLDPKYGESVVGSPKFNFLSERGVTPMSDWHFQGPAGWPKVQPGTGSYLSDPIRGLGDIDYLSNTVTLGPDVVPWAGGNTPGGLWNKLNNLDIPYEEKVKRFGEHIMKMKNNVDFSGQQKLYGDAFKRQFPIELHDGTFAHPNPINNQLLNQLRNAYKLNKEGGELPKAQPGKEVGKGIFQRFVNPFIIPIKPPTNPFGIIPGRSYQDVARKLNSLSTDLGITRGYNIADGALGASYFFPKSWDISAQGAIMNNMYGKLNAFEGGNRLMDGNTTYWLGREYGVDWDKFYESYKKEKGIYTKDFATRTHPQLFRRKNMTFSSGIDEYNALLNLNTANPVNVVKPFDLISNLDGTAVGYTMEHATGLPLLASKMDLPNFDVQNTFKNLEYDVANFHNQGLVHGDLHGGNIIVNPDGSYKIIDPVGIPPLDNLGINSELFNNWFLGSDAYNKSYWNSPYRSGSPKRTIDEFHMQLKNLDIDRLGKLKKNLEHAKKHGRVKRLLHTPGRPRPRLGRILTPTTLQDGGEYMDLDLTEEQIQNFKNQGFEIDELPKAHEGGRPGHVHPKGEYTSEEEYQKALEEYKNIYAKRQKLKDLNLKYSNPGAWNAQQENDIVWKDILDEDAYLKSGSDQKFPSLQEELDWLDKENIIGYKKKDLLGDDMHLQRMLDAGYITQEAYDEKYGKRPDWSKAKTKDEVYDLFNMYDDQGKKIKGQKLFGIDKEWYNKHINEPLKKKFPNKKEYDIERDKVFQETAPYNMENYYDSDWYKENITPLNDKGDDIYNRRSFLEGKYITQEADIDNRFEYDPRTVMDHEYKWANPLGTGDAYQYAYQNEDDLNEAFEYYKKDINEEINEEYPISGYRLKSGMNPRKTETVYKKLKSVEDTDLGKSHTDDKNREPLLDATGNIVTKTRHEEHWGNYLPYWDLPSARKPYLISPEELEIRDRTDYQNELKDLGLYDGNITGEDTEDWQTALKYFGDESTYDIQQAYVDKGLNPDGTAPSTDQLSRDFPPPAGYTAVLGDTDPAFGTYGNYYTSLTGEGEDIPFGKTEEDYLKWKEDLNSSGYPVNKKRMKKRNKKRVIKASFHSGGYVPEHGYIPTAQYGKNINLHLPKYNKQDAWMTAGGAGAGFLSSMPNLIKNYKVDQLSEYMCGPGYRCPSGIGKGNQNLFVGQANTQLGYNNPVEGNVGKAWGNTALNTAIGAGTGYLSSLLYDKIRGRRQKGGSVPRFQDGGGYYSGMPEEEYMNLVNPGGFNTQAAKNYDVGTIGSGGLNYDAALFEDLIKSYENNEKIIKEAIEDFKEENPKKYEEIIKWKKRLQGNTNPDKLDAKRNTEQLGSYKGKTTYIYEGSFDDAYNLARYHAGEDVFQGPKYVFGWVNPNTDEIEYKHTFSPSEQGHYDDGTPYIEGFTYEYLKNNPEFIEELKNYWNLSEKERAEVDLKNKDANEKFKKMETFMKGKDEFMQYFKNKEALKNNPNLFDKGEKIDINKQNSEIFNTALNAYVKDVLSPTTANKLIQEQKDAYEDPGNLKVYEVHNELASQNQPLGPSETTQSQAGPEFQTFTTQPLDPDKNTFTIDDAGWWMTYNDDSQYFQPNQLGDMLQNNHETGLSTWVGGPETDYMRYPELVQEANTEIGNIVLGNKGVYNYYKNALPKEIYDNLITGQIENITKSAVPLMKSSFDKLHERRERRYQEMQKKQDYPNAWDYISWAASDPFSNLLGWGVDPTYRGGSWADRYSRDIASSQRGLSQDWKIGSGTAMSWVTPGVQWAPVGEFVINDGLPSTWDLATNDLPGYVSDVYNSWDPHFSMPTMGNELPEMGLLDRTKYEELRNKRAFDKEWNFENSIAENLVNTAFTGLSAWSGAKYLRGFGKSLLNPNSVQRIFPRGKLVPNLSPGKGELYQPGQYYKPKTSTFSKYDQSLFPQSSKGSYFRLPGNRMILTGRGPMTHYEQMYPTWGNKYFGGYKYGPASSPWKPTILDPNKYPGLNVSPMVKPNVMIKPTLDLVEPLAYEHGGEYDLTDAEIKKLKKQGYEIEYM